MNELDGQQISIFEYPEYLPKDYTVKVFISQKMKGLTDAEIKLNRENAITEVRKIFGDTKVFIVDSFIRTEAPIGVNVPVWYMGESIKRLSNAQYIYFADGLNDSNKGCMLEYQCAKSYGIIVINESEILMKRRDTNE